MIIARTAAVATLILALGGCTTLQNARDRIVRAPPRCPDQTVQIYFEADSAEVTDEGRAVIAQAASEAKSCVVKNVEVLGLADAAGAPDANLELSKKRAQSVTAALAASGLPAAEFRVAAAGQAGSTTAEGRAAPLRRRADVVLHLSTK
jgi:outer membrane protein OmpA-like peptidoglycan-associated protein